MTRESPPIGADFSLMGKRVVAVSERWVRTRGLPKVISADNGLEFISKALDEWAHCPIAGV